MTPAIRKQLKAMAIALRQSIENAFSLGEVLDLTEAHDDAVFALGVTIERERNVQLDHAIETAILDLTFANSVVDDRDILGERVNEVIQRLAGAKLLRADESR